MNAHIANDTGQGDGRIDVLEEKKDRSITNKGISTGCLPILFYSTISVGVILNGIQVETNMVKRKEKNISSIFSSNRMKN
jgi:hypothetical protein